MKLKTTILFRVIGCFLITLFFYQCKKSSENSATPSVDTPACRIIADVTETGQKIMEFNYNDKNQLTEIISNGWNSDGSLLYFNKRTIEWNNKNQQVKVNYYKQNSPTEIEFYSEYEYDSQRQLIAIHNFNSKNQFISHEVREYNIQGQLIKKIIDGVNSSIGFEYDGNGDLIKSGFLNSEGVIIKPNSTVYEYDTFRPAFTIPTSQSSIYSEDVVRSMFMYDFTHSNHFCKRVYRYGAFGELISDSSFEIEKINSEGNPETIVRFVNGDKNLKATYQYLYGCNQ